MSALAEHLGRYLALRRALGFRLAQHEDVLRSFVSFVEARGGDSITVGAALAFASDTTESQAARRLSIIRVFARHLAAIDPSTEVQPKGCRPERRGRRAPHVFSCEEVTALMDAARRQRPELWGLSLATMVGLAFTTGLRPTEIRRLDRDDVSLGDGQLAVMHSKGGKSRLLPLHPSTVEALSDYAELRDLVVGGGETAFFVDRNGARIPAHVNSAAFARLRSEVAIPTAPGGRPARLGDLRHSFAVATMVDWHHAGVDVQRHLPVLSAYLGHLRPAHTYWYLEAVPELMAPIAERLAAAWEGQL
jgi:integrase